MTDNSSARPLRIIHIKLKWYFAKSFKRKLIPVSIKLLQFCEERSTNVRCKVASFPYYLQVFLQCKLGFCEAGSWKKNRKFVTCHTQAPNSEGVNVLFYCLSMHPEIYSETHQRKTSAKMVFIKKNCHQKIQKEMARKRYDSLYLSSSRRVIVDTLSESIQPRNWPKAKLTKKKL